MSTLRIHAGVCRRLLSGVLVLSLSAIALAVVPPGATVAPSTADTSAAFPKRITARGPGFGKWTGGLANPFFGRAGSYALPEVDGTDQRMLGAYLEFDTAGNTLRRISPIQLGVTIEPAVTAGRFFAQQTLTGESDVTWGLYSTINNAPIFQNRLAGDPEKIAITPTGIQDRTVVTRDLNTAVEVMVFRSDGTLEWARSLTSAGFGVSSGAMGETQTAFPLPLPDGSIVLHVIKSTITPLPSLSISYQTTLVKLSSSGGIEWAKRPSGNGFFSAIPSVSGNFLYMNGTEAPTGSTTATDSTLTKVTPAGAIVWSKRISGAATAGTGDLPGDKLLLSGSRTSQPNPMALPTTAAVLAVLGSSGALEAQIQYSFGERNTSVVVPDGPRIWITTVSGSFPTPGSPQLGTGPVYVGLTDATLSNIRWRRYKNSMHFGFASPDFDSEDVIASFFDETDGALEVMAFKDDFAASVNSDLLPDATTTVSSPGITLSDAGITLSDVTVNATGLTPTIATGNLTFETLTVTETSIGSGSGGGTTAPTISGQPQSQTVTPGAAASFSVALNNPSSVAVTYQWSFNGAPIAGATSSTLAINFAQPANVGVYSVAVTAGSTVITSQAASLQLNATIRPIGDSILFAGDIQHPNGNVYDQFLMTGTASTITADPGQIARISFVDANDDIVQVEYSGPGTLTLTLASASGPATPVNYNQPTVQYMKGRPTITIQGATEASNLGIFSVGAITGNVAVLKPGTIYNGLADVALVNIASANGRFGQMTTGNVRFSAASGDVGLNAPGVNFDRQVVIGDIDATGSANPKLVTGAVGGLAGFAGEIRIAGGDLLQANAKPIEYGTALAVRMGAGTDSHGTALPAQTNRGVLQRNGQDVTQSVIRGP
jgi:hypothetical protein